MDINELKKRLYKKDPQLSDRPKPPEEFVPGLASAPEPDVAPQWSAEDGGRRWVLTPALKRKLWLAGGLLGLAVLVVGGWAVWRSWNSFDTRGVSLNIFGQERVVSGEEVNYVVRYKNNSKVAIANARLEFYFSAQALPVNKDDATARGDSFVAVKSLGQLAPGQEGQAEFKARVLGDKDSQQKFVAKLIYRPLNINADFGNEGNFVSTIISVPLVLSFILPERIVSGQTINFSLRYLNTSDASFSGAKLKIDYPEGFIFDSALPSPDESNNVWHLAEIGSREEGNIIIKGAIAGNEGESKVFKAQIGTQKDDEDFVVYSQTLSSPQIFASPLFVEQSLVDATQNSATAGQTLKYRIKYRNTTDVAIGPVFITVKIDGRAVDLASVQGASGFFSSSDSLITWNSASLPALESLAPQAEGTVDFSLRVKERLPINNFSDKNFVVTTTAKIDSFNTPLALSGTQLAGQNQLAVKVNSRVVLSMKGYYSDQLIPNSGPLPLKVGQKTTYTIYWQVLNTSNDVSDITVKAYLPSYVRWEGSFFPKDEDIKYDAASGQVIWRIGKLSSSVGILSPVRQVAFQVGVIPSLGQVGSVIVVVQPGDFSGQDDFTGARLSVEADELKSDMPDDPTVGSLKEKVTQ